MPPKTKRITPAETAKRKTAGPPDRRTPERKQAQFLRRYAETCNVRDAAKLARIDRGTHYDWLAKHPDYAQRFEAQRKIALDTLESEAIHRAKDGYEEPIYYQGAKCGRVTRYSDGLMQFLLRGLMPERYGQKTEISGPQGAPIQATVEVVIVRPGDVAADNPHQSPVS